MKDIRTLWQFRRSTIWARCFAVAFVLSGFGGVKLAAASALSGIEIGKSTQQSTIDLDLPNASWVKSEQQASTSETAKPSIKTPAQPTSKTTTKTEFLQRQSQGSAKLLASSPGADFVAQAPEPQNAEELRQQLTIEPLVELRIPAYSPGSSVGVPTAFGANFGDAFVGLSLSNRRPRVNEADGAISVGFGLGDSERTLGLEVSANIGSLRRFARNGDLGFKLHRALPGKAAIAVGWDSGITWGEENDDTVSTIYGVATKVFDLRPEDQDNSLPLTLTLGVGGGRFRSFDNIVNGRGGVGVFASAGLRVVPQASVIGSWTGQDLNLGVSYVPLKTTPLFLTFVVGNVLNRNDNATLFSLGIGYGFNYTGYQF